MFGGTPIITKERRTFYQCSNWLCSWARCLAVNLKDLNCIEVPTFCIFKKKSYLHCVQRKRFSRDIFPLLKTWWISLPGEPSKVLFNCQFVLCRASSYAFCWALFGTDSNSRLCIYLHVLLQCVGSLGYISQTAHQINIWGKSDWSSNPVCMVERYEETHKGLSNNGV